MVVLAVMEVEVKDIIKHELMVLAVVALYIMTLVQQFLVVTEEIEAEELEETVELTETMVLMEIPVTTVVLMTMNSLATIPWVLELLEETVDLQGILLKKDLVLL